MNANCLDIGTIQAFLDGETESSVSLRVADHISRCEACATMLSAAEDESAMVFTLLEREFNTLVPTQRLWTKINDSLDIEKRSAPFWKKIWIAAASLQLSSPSLAVAASVLIVFGFFIAYFNGRQDAVAPEQASSVSSAVPQSPAPVVAQAGDMNEIIAAKSGQPTFAAPAAKNAERMIAVKTAYREPKESGRAGTARPALGPIDASADSSGYVPGEESYVKTIENLTQAVSGQKDTIMRPAERIAFERDLAVVEDSIEKIRKEVRKNPRNESAKQVLYTSYQNKIDLLNSVSQKEDLIASLR